MPRIERSAAIAWEGNLARGSGRLSGDSSKAFADLPYTLASRIGDPEGKTSPEELLAAAHGGCLVMSIAGQLTRAGTPPERLEATNTVRLEEVDGKNTITAATTSLRGRVPDADRAAFDQAVKAGHEGCPFSRLLAAAGVELSIDAQLEES